MSLTITVPQKNPCADPAIEQEWGRKAGAFLSQLPNTQQALVEFFTDEGIVGRRNSGAECPFANYLRRVMAPFGVTNAWVTAQAVLLNDGPVGARPLLDRERPYRQVVVPLPPHAQEFIRQFDNCCLLADSLYYPLVAD